MVTVRYWACRKCGHRNVRTASRKCQGCSENTKPKTRVPAHARTLRDNTYERFVEVNQRIHGAGEACGLCGKPKGGTRHQREHDHRTGNPRGLACWRCNHQLLRFHTLETARATVAYLERVDEFYEREVQVG